MFLSFGVVYFHIFISKNGGLNRKGQIICPFEIASKQVQSSQPILAVFDQIGDTGQLAFSKGQTISPFWFNPSLLIMREDQNIKKLESSSSKGICK